MSDVQDVFAFAISQLNSLLSRYGASVEISICSYENVIAYMTYISEFYNFNNERLSSTTEVEFEEIYARFNLVKEWMEKYGDIF